jgi:RNA polymerase sigma factor (sigma-70 family)
MVEMHEKSDVQLLRDYAEDGHEAAFRELVTRHADFVFSAALRQVNSPDLAGDIAQGVFTDLAHKARTLAEQMPGSLAGWLHRSTRYAALNHLRDTRRRLANERQAMEQLLINSESAPDWERIRPVLDEALDSLGDEDREALLLRYFKNQDFRAVGLALGISDDTAQKRVSRAVERLREFFSKRNVTIGASGLVVLISANAIQAAPVGLAATISAAAILAGTAVHTSTLIAATKTIAMTTLQKTLITATLAVVAGAGIYEAHQAAQLQNQIQTLQQQQVPMAEQIQQLQSNFADATNRLANLLAENARLNANPHQLELLKLRSEVTILRNELVKRMAASQASNHDSASDEEAPYKRLAKLLTQYFEENPNARIPEMNLLPKDYLQSIYGLAAVLAAQNDPAYHGKRINDDDLKLETNEEYRRAASELRSYAECNVAPMVADALKSFLQANNGAYPTSASNLQPFFTNSIDAAILQRYEIQPASNFSQIQSKYDSSGRISGSVITPRAAVDADFDHRIIIGLNNYMVGESGSFKQ